MTALSRFNTTALYFDVTVAISFFKHYQVLEILLFTALVLGFWVKCSLMMVRMGHFCHEIVVFLQEIVSQQLFLKVSQLLLSLMCLAHQIL